MSKPVRQPRPVNGHDERNLARLSLVLANNRVPKTQTSWIKEFVSSDELGTTIRVECTAPRQDVVPHGMDNDILLGLVNAYIAAGMPISGVLRTTSYNLLQYSSLADSGFHYSSLAESLRRFQGTVYKITDSWYDNEHYQYRSINTSLVMKFVVVDKDRQPDAFKELKADSLLEITLDSDLTASIRGGFIRPLDLQFLRKLSQPLPRLLFRVLSEQRHPHDQPSVGSYQVSLRAWGQHLGILDDRAFRIRRTLDPAHKQLIEQGFLKGVDYLGRGETQEVLYTFAELALPPANPEAVSLLTQRGVSHAISVQLAAEHGADAIQRQVQKFDGLIAGGYKVRNKAALLVDVIRNPAKYPESGPAAPALAPVPRRITLEAPEPLLEPPRTPAGARVLLISVRLPEPLLQRAIELFVAGTVSATELLSLKQDKDSARTVTKWIERQEA